MLGFRDFCRRYAVAGDGGSHLGRLFAFASGCLVIRPGKDPACLLRISIPTFANAGASGEDRLRLPLELAPTQGLAGTMGAIETIRASAQIRQNS